MSHQFAGVIIAVLIIWSPIAFSLSTVHHILEVSHMDPTACAQALSEAIADEDFEAAELHAESLADWLRGGGFEPAKESMIELLEKLQAHFVDLT